MSLNNLDLNDSQRKALYQLKKRINNKYSIVETLVFGSVARNEAEIGSDLDVLVVTNKGMSHKEKHEIYALVTEVNLEYNTNLSVLIVDKVGWESGLYSVLPIKDEIKRDGVRF